MSPVKGGGGGGGGGGAPIDAEYVVEAAHAGLSAEVLIGTVNENAAYGSLTAAAKDGRTKWPTDSFYLLRDTGSILSPWGPIFPMVEPVDADFAWINQGGASVDITKGGIFLNAPANAGDALRLRTKAAPTPPYTITVAFVPLIYQETTHMCGVFFRQSSDGKLQIFSLGYHSSTRWRFLIEKWTNPTTFSAAYKEARDPLLGRVWFFRIEDDNVDRKCYFSYDGQNWMELHSIGRTDFLTADQVGFFSSSNNAGHNTGMLLLSWEEA